MPERRVGWQPSRFLANRAKAERAVALAEQLGRVNAAAAELSTTWPSLRKAFATALAYQPATHTRSTSGRSPPPAAAAGRPATPAWTRCPVALNPGALPARERPAPSCMRGSAATSSTPSWGPTWWSS
jgi:hypothetical protein